MIFIDNISPAIVPRRRKNISDFVPALSQTNHTLRTDDDDDDEAQFLFGNNFFRRTSWFVNHVGLFCLLERSLARPVRSSSSSLV